MMLHQQLVENLNISANVINMMVIKINVTNIIVNMVINYGDVIGFQIHDSAKTLDLIVVYITNICLTK